MADWTPDSFNIATQSDSQVIAAFQQIINLSPLKFQKGHVEVVATKDVVPFGSNIADDPSISALLKLNSAVVRQFRLILASNVQIEVTRMDSTKYDVAVVSPGNRASEMAGKKEVDLPYVEVVALAKEHLHATKTARPIEELVGPILAGNLIAWEGEVNKLSDVVIESTRTVAAYRSQLDSEYEQRKQRQEEEFSKHRSEHDRQHAARLNELTAEKEMYENRVAEINDRENKHERRRLSEDIKKVLKSRSDKFELTKGTRELRTPVSMFSKVLLLLFGLGMVAYAATFLWKYYSLDSVSLAAIWPLLVGQLGFAIGFASTAVFYIRWHSTWFKQHAEEEFKLKRLEIDLDRASWLVEMAMEWHHDKGVELPAELQRQLGANLFGGEATDRMEMRHPADQLASAIMGSAARLKVSLPGADIELDRKGINKLKESEGTPL